MVSTTQQHYQILSSGSTMVTMIAGQHMVEPVVNSVVGMLHIMSWPCSQWYKSVTAFGPPALTMHTTSYTYRDWFVISTVYIQLIKYFFSTGTTNVAFSDKCWITLKFLLRATLSR